MTGSYLRLDDFDDFVEVAQGCTHIFYQATDLTSLNSFQREVRAYAGRVYWIGTFEKDSNDGYEETITQLHNLRAKRVLETSDQVFR